MRKLGTNLLALGLMMFAAASASATEILDQGNFFSPEALKTANQTISELEAKYQHQIHIETYASVPADKAASVAKMSKADRDAFFVKWIKQRAQATNAKGLFLLICKEPAHVHSVAGQSLAQQGFTPQARQRVVEALLERFRGKQYDDGLKTFLTQVGTEFSKLSASPARGRAMPIATPPAPHVAQEPNAGGNFGGLIMIGLFIVGGLILLSVLGRAFSGGGMAGAGGGFGTGLFGGLLGALAGNWLYDSFSGHHGQAFGSDSSHPSTFGDNSSSSGSDFGSGADFGGGDFGGGDFGGGDFGGGDFGGGGDF